MKVLTKIKPTHRYAITIGTIVASFFIWFTCLYTNLAAHIKNEKTKILQSETQQELIKKTKMEIEVLEKATIETRRALEPYLFYTNNITNKNPKSPHIGLILRNIKESGLLLTKCIASQATEDKLYKNQKVTYLLNGPMQNAISFCNQIKKCNHALKCEEVTIAHSQNNSCAIKLALQFIWPKKS